MSENLEPKPVISFKDADIYNEDNLILSNISFDIYEGDLLYIVGRVGSGKSSIIKTIIGEIPLNKGEVEVLNYNLGAIKRGEIPYLRRNIGVVFQDFQLLADRTIEENLRFVLECTGWKEKEKISFRCDEVLKMVGLETKSHKLPHQLSGGEQQRVAIARALLNSPKVILADEPTGNLDALSADGIMNLLMSIHNEYKTTIVIVTHNRNLLENYPGRIILCSDGSLKEVIQSEEREQFILSSEDDLPI